MTEFLIYLLGWVLFIICYYIYYMYIVKDGSYTYKYNCNKNKKLILYNGFKYGIFSWGGILFWGFVIIAGSILYGLYSLDNYIEQKLK